MKRRSTRINLASALSISAILLAGCGGGSDSPAPTPAAPTPAAPTPAAPTPAAPTPIALAASYDSQSFECSKGVSGEPGYEYFSAIDVFYSSPTTVFNYFNGSQFTAAYNTGTTQDPNPTGTDDAPPTAGGTALSATYNGTAVLRDEGSALAEPYVLTLSVSHDGILLGTVYNPSTNDSVFNADNTVRCGNQYQAPPPI